MIPPPPRSPLFPYTTLFRSARVQSRRGLHHEEAGLHGTRRARRHGSVAVGGLLDFGCAAGESDRKSTRLNSSHPSISYAVFCLKKKTNTAARVGVRSRQPGR